MRQMKYTKPQKGKIILEQGESLGYKYLILSLSTHPTAYVFIDKNHPLYKKHYDDIDVDVHGGLTFSDDHLINVLKYSDKYKCETLQRINHDWIIGWDYNHLGDYSTYYGGFDDKKWTTEEILIDVFSVIAQLKLQEKLGGEDDRY